MKSIIKRTLAILLLSALLLCTGCWSKMEPKELALIHSIIYDITDDGQIKITAEIMDPSGISGASGTTGGAGGGQHSPALTVEATGQSAREALAHLAFNVEKNIFGGHNKARFFTEAFAKRDMASLLDFFLRDHLTDETPLMIVIKDKMPENIHFARSGLADMVGDYFEDLSEMQRLHTSKSVFVTTLEFLKDYLTDGKQPVAGVAKMEAHQGQPQTDSESGGEGQNSGGEESQNTDNGGESSGKMILYEGLAAFKEGKLVGYMDGEEARAYNILINDLGVSYASLPSGDGVTTMLISDSSADIKTRAEGEEVKVNVKIKMSLRMIEQGGDIDVTQSQWLSLIEHRFNKQMEEEISAAIQKAQIEFDSDIFGFGRHMHRQHPEEWKRLKADWDTHFSSAAVNVTVESTVIRTGQLKQPVKWSKENE